MNIETIRETLRLKLREASRHMLSANNIIEPTFAGPARASLDVQELRNAAQQLRQAVTELEQIVGAMDAIRIFREIK